MTDLVLHHFNLPPCAGKVRGLLPAGADGYWVERAS